MVGNVERTNWIVVLGWFGLAVAAMYYLFHNQIPDADKEFVRNARDIALVSAALIVGGYLLRKAKRKLGVGQGRCKRCHKVIPAGEVYCYDHSIKQIWEAKERFRDK